MFGEERYGESPRLPSPWREIAARGQDTDDSFEIGTIPKARDADSDVVNKAFQRLRLSGNHALIPEADEVGHIEYKLRLRAQTPDRFNKLVTQLKWRLFEGGGEALYEIGVLDHGELVGLPLVELDASLDTLRSMANVLDCDIEILREIEIATCRAKYDMLRQSSIPFILSTLELDSVKARQPILPFDFDQSVELVVPVEDATVFSKLPTPTQKSNKFSTKSDLVEEVMSLGDTGHSRKSIPSTGITEHVEVADLLNRTRDDGATPPKTSPIDLLSNSQYSPSQRWCAEVRIFSRSRATSRHSEMADDSDDSNGVAFLDFEGFLEV